MIRSGGFFYHLRALRFRDRFWAGHLEGTARFLESWNPKSRSILLVGPSGGYSIPRGWLSRFETISAYEPDPIARFVFERRHRVKPHWIRRRFPFRSLDPLSQVPPTTGAVLFCNLLGQIVIQNPGKLSKKLRAGLEGREWASYHDALSGARIEFDLEDVRPGRASIHDMKGWVYVPDRGRGVVEVNAHTAPELFRDWPGLRFSYWQWRIVPGYTHLIEGVYQDSSVTRPDSILTK
jgi:hypothetical protein